MCRYALADVGAVDVRSGFGSGNRRSGTATGTWTLSEEATVNDQILNQDQADANDGRPTE